MFEIFGEFDTFLELNQSKGTGNGKQVGCGEFQRYA